MLPLDYHAGRIGLPKPDYALLVKSVNGLTRDLMLVTLKLLAHGVVLRTDPADI